MSTMSHSHSGDLVPKALLEEGLHHADRTRTACGQQAKKTRNESEINDASPQQSYSQVRGTMISEIETHIKKLDPTLDSQKASTLARHLDAKLYKSSPFSVYADANTLEERLRTLATGLGLQLQRQKSARTLSQNKRNFAEERRDLLRRRVGDGLYDEIFDLVREIETIRRTNNVWTTEWSKRKEGEGEKAAAALMSAELKAIYFGTRLVVAEKALVANTPTLGVERVNDPDWSELVEEARANVAAFRSKEREAKATGKAQLGCSNSEGTCCFKW